MKIEKEMVSKLPREYLFVSGILDLNVKYFKKRIEEGVKASNINYKTNVYGRHTAWDFFNKDKEFGLLLCQMIDHLESLSMDLQRFYLTKTKEEEKEVGLCLIYLTTPKVLRDGQLN